VVPRVRRARANRFLLLVAGLLVGGLVGLLLLNLSMQKGAFELAAIQQQTAQLDTAEQALAYDLQRMESTSRLARRATQLGMVRNDNPVFLDLTDGSVIGAPVPAAAPAVVAVPEPRREDRAGDEEPDTPTDDRRGAAREGDTGGSQEQRRVRSSPDAAVGEGDQGTRSRR
jgi:hypothetical protein